MTHATLIPRPLHHEGWVYEEKADGYRMVAYRDVMLPPMQLDERRRPGPKHLLGACVLLLASLSGAAAHRDANVFTSKHEVAIFDDKLISRFEWF